MKRLMYICVTFIASIYFPALTYSQKLTHAQIDSLLIKVAPSVVQSKDFEEVLAWNKNLLRKSEEQHYVRGIVLSKLNIANRYWNYGKLDECISLLNDVKNTIRLELQEDYYIIARLYQYYSQAYNTMTLFKLAIDNNFKAIGYALKIDSVNLRNSLISNIYLTRSNIFNNLKQPDSTKYYLFKSYEFKKNPVVLVDIAAHYMQNERNDDSARSFLDKAMAYINDDKKKARQYDKSVTYFMYGKYFLNKQNYNEAAVYMEKALSFGLDKKNYNHLSDVYRHLVLCYKKSDNIVMENKYLAKYNELKDSINETQARLIEESIKQIEEHETKITDKNINLFVYTGISIFIFSGLVVLLFRSNKKKQQKLHAKEEIIRQNIELLEIKQEEVELLKKRVEAKKAFILEKEEETEVLKKKVNNITEELTELARNNDPLLLSKFQEAYPEIISKLLQINSGLTQPDLIFCIYLWLGFSSKEIANYTFTQHRSMQTKKNRLRKKLNLDSDVDLYLFLRNEL